MVLDRARSEARPDEGVWRLTEEVVVPRHELSALTVTAGDLHPNQQRVKSYSGSEIITNRQRRRLCIQKHTLDCSENCNSQQTSQDSGIRFYCEELQIAN